jgi:hypothetical protein
MRPFRTSFTARGLSIGASIALVGAGLTAVTGAEPSVALPIVFLLSAALGIVSLVAGVHTYPGNVAILAFLMPMAFWPYVLGALVIVAHAPTLGYGLIAAGLVPLALTIAAPYVPVAERPAQLASRAA